MDAYEESAQAAQERERIKKEEKALKRWMKLMNGLRVRRRLQAEYGQSDNVRPPRSPPTRLDAYKIAQRTIV
jgi:xeroderma pigmentosum group C-complementing protein